MVDDKTLVSRVLIGDMQAFRLLIQQNERLVAHMVGRVIKNREELEEICQDVFMKVYDKLGEFGFQSKLSTWIGTIAYRLALNTLRKNKLEVTDIPEEDRFTAYFVNDESQSIFKEYKVDNRNASLKWGLIILSAGIGLIIIDAMKVSPDSTLPYGIFAVAVSIGYLVYFFMAKREIR